VTGGRGKWEWQRMTSKIKTHEDLDVYQLAFRAAMKIFELSKEFPAEERYSLTDQNSMKYNTKSSMAW
jgi:hypothetical protein